MSGLVGSLRRETTQERLRSDHIMTLELFQATVDENGELKEEVQRLKKQLAGSIVEGGDEDGDSGEAGKSAKSGGASLVQKVLKQEKELKELREQVKVLKAKGVQDDMTIAKLTKSNSSNEALKMQLDSMLKEAAERDAREAAEREAANKSPPVELHDHEECLETISALNQKMLQNEKDFSENREKLEKEVLKQSAVNTSLLESNKALQEENEELKSSLSSWERKHKEFQRARDMQERALQDKIHASDLQISKLEQEATGHLDAAALLEELEVVRSQRGQLEIANNDQAMEIRRLKERVEQLEEERSGANPLLLPSAQQQQPSTADSAFFLTGAQPTGQAQAQAQTGPQAGAGGFAEFVQLKKENKSLKAQLQQLQRKGAPILTGPSKGVAPGSLL